MMKTTPSIVSVVRGKKTSKPKTYSDNDVSLLVLGDGVELTFGDVKSKRMLGGKDSRPKVTMSHGDVLCMGGDFLFSAKNVSDGGRGEFLIVAFRSKIPSLSLEGFPQEILERILLNLSYKDLQDMRATNKNIKGIIEGYHFVKQYFTHRPMAKFFAMDDMEHENQVWITSKPGTYDVTNDTARRMAIDYHVEKDTTKIDSIMFILRHDEKYTSIYICDSYIEFDWDGKKTKFFKEHRVETHRVQETFPGFFELPVNERILYMVAMTRVGSEILPKKRHTDLSFSSWNYHDFLLFLCEVLARQVPTIFMDKKVIVCDTVMVRVGDVKTKGYIDTITLISPDPYQHSDSKTKPIFPDTISIDMGGRENGEEILRGDLPPSYFGVTDEDNEEWQVILYRVKKNTIAVERDGTIVKTISRGSKIAKGANQIFWSTVFDAFDNYWIAKQYFYE